MEKDSKIYIAGHSGLVGSAILRKLKSEGYKNIITRSHSELDLTRQQQAEEFFAKEKPEYVFLAAAKVGGILANSTYPAEFIYDNIMISTNIIHASYKYNVKKLLNLGSSCIYPKLAPQPLKEEYLLTGLLEPTNEPYAIAKIAAIKMCRYFNEQYGTNFISVMPTNLYGPGDNFNLETSHVLPAMLRKIHLAKCLENNDMKTIRKDLNKRPIENIDAKASNEAILNILSKYGISRSSSIPSLKNKKVISVNSCNSWTGNNKNISENPPAPYPARAGVLGSNSWTGNNKINHRLSQINTDDKNKNISENPPAPYPARAGVLGSKSVVKLSLWGTGSPRREFLYVDDLADAVVFLMKTLHASRIIIPNHQSPITNYASHLTPYEFINIGTGKDLTIKELAEMIKNIVGFKGKIEWDTSKPDGTPRKLLDVSRISELGWQAKTRLEEGIKKTYEWYKTLC